MVLKDSKYAKRDKYRYLKKHGLVPPKNAENPINRPKWSSKRKDIKPANTIKLADSDEEWDTEDEDEFLKQYHPEIKLEELQKEQKQKIIEQIIEELQNAHEEKPEAENVERDGIYLGSEAQQEKDTQEKEASDEHESKLKLDAFIGKEILPSRTNKRKILKNKFSENLLEEYGLDSYADTVSKTKDYSERIGKNAKSHDWQNMSVDVLDGFKIGDKLDKPKGKQHSERVLTEEEILQKEEMSKKIEDKKLYDRILKKLNETKKPNKVLEINNLDANDERQLHALENKLSRAGDNGTSSINTDNLLAELDVIPTADEGKLSSVGATTDIDALMADLKIEPRQSKKSEAISPVSETPNISRKAPPPSDESFLDDLLN